MNKDTISYFKRKNWKYIKINIHKNWDKYHLSYIDNSKELYWYQTKTYINTEFKSLEDCKRYSYVLIESFIS